MENLEFSGLTGRRFLWNSQIWVGDPLNHRLTSDKLDTAELGALLATEETEPSLFRGAPPGIVPGFPGPAVPFCYEYVVPPRIIGRSSVP